ncbi:MAG: radical SAM protein [Pseudomonadota bacterium]
MTRFKNFANHQMNSLKQEINSSYTELSLSKRKEDSLAELANCKLCPRECGVNRLNDEKGVCNTGRFARVASHNLHFGEEPPISGTKGSGTIFFAYCNLKCAFCQNYPISQLGNGEITPPEKLARMMISLQKRGAHNINLVTASHVVPQFIEALHIAASDGLKIPIVYNTSGYDGMKSLKLLDGIVDIYMPDIKYSDDRTAMKYSSAPKYWEIATKAVREMYRQVGNMITDDEDIAKKGLLIRHLVLPDNLSGSEKVFEFIASEISRDVPVNLMSQYFPANKGVSDPVIGRRVNKEEFCKAEKLLKKFGLENGWIQRL